MARRVLKRLPRQIAFTLTEVVVVIFIVVILAVLLLLNLHTDGRRPTRTPCMNNQWQFAKALEAYCGDYSGYLPCYPGWGIDPSLASASVIYQARIGNQQYDCAMSNLIGSGAVRTDEPLSLPQFGGKPIGTPCGQAFPGVNFFRTIFFGSPYGAPDSLKAGSACFAGPVGLGNLLVCGYIHDFDHADEAKVFFCPSAEGLPWDAGAQYSGVTRKDLATLIGNPGMGNAAAFQGGDYPALMKKLSGEKFNTFNCGWQNIGTGAPATGNGAYGFQSSYNYRCVPISTSGGGNPAPIVSANFEETTTPPVIAEPGCPQFKTQKMLLNRAIVCDTFSKWDDASVPADKKAGYGAYAHKDCYNVLYGDWHAKVLSDSKSQIQNWSQSAKGGIPLDQADISASIATIAYATATGENPHSSYAAMPAGDVTASEGFLIWHYFDINDGIDIK